MLRAQALADRAPAERAVEREVVRRQLFEAAAAAVALTVLAVTVHMPLGLVLSVADPGDRTTPLPRSSADSTESARRERVDRRTIARSTTTSIRCFRRWLSLGGLSRLIDGPSTRTRAKPKARSSSQSAS